MNNRIKYIEYISSYVGVESEFIKGDEQPEFHSGIKDD